MKVKNIVQEDYANYKTCAMFIGFPTCSWKCEKDCGLTGICQNGALAKAPSIEISQEEIVELYLTNPIHRALVCGGLEPFDSWEDLYELVACFRRKTEDPIIIYTGYIGDEISRFLKVLKQFSNIIVKFGRYVPGQALHYDEVLGVSLASNNQYAERIS